MGYDVMAAWEKRSFEFNDSIQERGGPYQGSISWQSTAGRTISQDDYDPPKFSTTTSRWSPPTSPSSASPRTEFPQSLSPKQTTSSTSASSSPKQSRSSSPRAESTASGSLIVSSMDAKSLASNLYAASAAGDVQHMKLLVSLGAPVNVGTTVPSLYEAFKPAKSGFLSPLAGAASFGQMEAAMYLISQGAEISPNINKSTSSPLQQACRANNIAMASYLLDHGADVNQANCFKSTPLMYAVKYGSPTLVSLILSYQPDLSAVSFMGSLATHWAIWPGRLDILELLLRAGADPDDKLADESTLLHCAALIGWLDGIKLLLSFGADVNKRDADYKTPEQVALANKQYDIAAILRAEMLLSR
ncbi:hypothetical protein AMS68_002880 [Peltaster fructicola]|uniref:Uncharacterized protein n=1 Tax=Peltaster fructicola TaxID=286661 RepID=A0A6H0XRM9_9PEZI|nr:hypothetical protein AMS68_002880 [Peltaster fructicola]